jgi:predicted NACHT family NTPase
MWGILISGVVIATLANVNTITTGTLRMRYEQLRAQSLQSAVQNAVSLARRVPNQPDHLLSPQTSIVHLHEQARGELLILGEPGAGKSPLLQELAYHLLQQAEQDTTQLLPVYRQRQL